MINRLREIPPTAGLPAHFSDFLPSRLRLEDSLQHYLGVPKVDLLSSGSAAWVIALRALKKLSARRSVVIPAYTCPLMAIAIENCGLKVVLCDVQKDHFDFCPHALNAICNEDTLALLPTHLAGRVADLSVARQAANKVGAYVVEDCAQSLGALWHGQPVGTIGDIGFYSFGVGKGLTMYGGGAIVAKDEAVRAAIQSVIQESISSSWKLELQRSMELMAYAVLYRPLALILAYGIPLRRQLKRGRLIQAVGDDYALNIPVHALGMWRKTRGAEAFKRLPSHTRITTAQALLRVERLAAIAGLTVLNDNAQQQGVWPVLYVLLPSEQARDSALSRLWQAGHGVGRMFIHALTDYPAIQHLFDSSDIPNARDFAARSLTISNSPWLLEDDFNKICFILEQSIG